MSKIEIKKDELVKYLVNSLALEGLKDAATNLKEIDWNPFDDDGDEYDTPWKEIVHNKDILVDVALALVNTAERIIIEGNKLTASQKHDAVVKALDDAISLPWYAEPFDGKLISLLVTSVVKTMNALKPQRSAPLVEKPKATKIEPSHFAGKKNPKFIANVPKRPATDNPIDWEDVPDNQPVIEIRLTPTGIFKEVG